MTGLLGTVLAGVIFGSGRVGSENLGKAVSDSRAFSRAVLKLLTFEGGPTCLTHRIMRAARKLTIRRI